MPKATSSPSISDEQKERMIRNRKLAEERRLARLKQSSMDSSTKQDSVIIEVDEEVETNVIAKRPNRSHVIDSSDDDCDVNSVYNQSVTVDVHNGTKESSEGTHNGEVVLEAGENLNDIEMEHKNDAEDEVNQDVVEIIDVADTNISRNTRVEQTDKPVEIIEINDLTDQIIERNEQTKVLVGVIDIDDESNQGTTEVIENNKLGGKILDDVVEIVEDVTHNESKISNDTEFVKENNDTTKVDLNTTDRAPQGEISSSIHENGSENQSTSTENSTQKDVVEEIEDDAKDSKSTNNIRDTSNLENNDKIVEGEVEDMMDVDFSEDF